MPESSAPPSMRPANVPVAGIPARSARFRRGSRGPRVTPPEIPKIGVVEVDPNFKPRIELVPVKPADVEVAGSASTPLPGSDADSRRGGGRGQASGRGREPRDREPG